MSSSGVDRQRPRMSRESNTISKSTCHGTALSSTMPGDPSSQTAAESTLWLKHLCHRSSLPAELADGSEFVVRVNSRRSRTEVCRCRSSSRNPLRFKAFSRYGRKFLDERVSGPIIDFEHKHSVPIIVNDQSEARRRIEAAFGSFVSFSARPVLHENRPDRRSGNASIVLPRR